MRSVLQPLRSAAVLCAEKTLLLCFPLPLENGDLVATIAMANRSLMQVLHDLYVAPIVVSILLATVLAKNHFQPTQPGSGPPIQPGPVHPTQPGPGQPTQPVPVYPTQPVLGDGSAGLVVVEVIPGTSAKSLLYNGRRFSLDPGDVITRIDGKVLNSTADFRNVIDAAPRDAKLQVELLVDGKSRCAVLELDKSNRYRAGFSVRPRARQARP